MTVFSYNVESDKLKSNFKGEWKKNPSDLPNVATIGEVSKTDLAHNTSESTVPIMPLAD